MSQTRPVTGLIGDTQRCPGVKLVTGRGSIGINATTNPATDLAFQRDTAGRRVIGAFHAHEFGGQQYGHIDGHAGAALCLRQFGGMKVHPVAGATGTATLADRGA